MMTVLTTVGPTFYAASIYNRYPRVIAICVDIAPDAPNVEPSCDPEMFQRFMSLLNTWKVTWNEARHLSTPTRHSVTSMLGSKIRDLSSMLVHQVHQKTNKTLVCRPLLTKCSNFNLNMDKKLYPFKSVGWNYLPIPKPYRCSRWSLGMDA